MSQIMMAHNKCFYIWKCRMSRLPISVIQAMPVTIIEMDRCFRPCCFDSLGQPSVISTVDAAMVRPSHTVPFAIAQGGLL